MGRYIKSGQVLVELLVAFGLMTLIIPTIFLGFISGSGDKTQTMQRIRALSYLKEAEEATRVFREASWTSFAVNGIFHPLRNGNTWILESGSDNIEEFTRSVEISDTTPPDPSIKQVIFTVSWGLLPQNSVTKTIYLTRRENTSQDLSVSGTLLNTGNGDWCAPSLTLASVDLDKNGVGKAISAIQGQIAAGTGDNASGLSYANITVDDPAAPTAPTPSIEGRYNPSGNYKTNDVFTETDYVYIATDTNSKEVDILDLNSLSDGVYSEIGWFNAPGNGNANSVATSGNIGYMTGGTKFYNFDLSSKSGSRPIIDADGVTLPGTAGKIMIYGQRAYVTTSSVSAQLVIIDISNSSNLVIRNQIDLDALAGKAVHINSTGTRAYVATASSISQREMFIVNIDETSGNFTNVMGSYDTNGMDPRGIVLVNLPKVIIVGEGAEEYQVVDVTVETTPTHCGGLNIDPRVNGVSTVFTTSQRAYAYIISDADPEIRIIEGGPGGGGSGGGLTIESAALDAGHSVVFNRINVTSLTPIGITAIYQVAVSTDCSTYNYTGNYTSSGGQIPIDINPGRCFKYRVTFSGGNGGENVSSTVSVNYSP